MSGSDDHDQDHEQNSGQGGSGGSGIPAKRAIEEQDRKVSMDDGQGSGKKKRVSLSCAQCESEFFVRSGVGLEGAVTDFY